MSHEELEASFLMKALHAEMQKPQDGNRLNGIVAEMARENELASHASDQMIREGQCRLRADLNSNQRVGESDQLPRRFF